MEQIDQAKMFGDRISMDQRLSQIYDKHVDAKPLCRIIINKNGAGAVISYFDPWGGSVNVEVITLMSR